MRDLVLALAVAAVGGSAGWRLVAAFEPPLDVASATRYAGHAAWCLSRPYAPTAEERWHSEFFFSMDGVRRSVVLKTVNLRGTRPPPDPV